MKEWRRYMFIVPMSGFQTISETQNMQSITGVNNYKPKNTNSTGFTKIFEEAYENARDTTAVSNQDAIDLALGNVDNLSEVMINASKASTATQLAVDLTSRAVSIYKEIMQMSV